jgi:flagellar hook assembly protein FlgD
VNILFTLPSARTVDVEVFDVAGRRIASPIVAQTMARGEQRVTWDGRDSTGRRAPRGVYEVRVTSGETIAVRRVVAIE